MANPEFGKSIKPGRPKGCKNKLTLDLKQALMAPFDPERFKKWALSKEDAYFTLIITKLLPKDVNLSGSIDLAHSLIGLKKGVDK